jgi:hypothetical protein
MTEQEPNNNELFDALFSAPDALEFDTPPALALECEHNARPIIIINVAQTLELETTNTLKRRQSCEEPTEVEHASKRLRSLNGTPVASPTAGDQRNEEAGSIIDVPKQHLSEAPRPGEEGYRYLVSMGNKRNRPKKTAKTKPKEHPEDKYTMKFSLMK